MSLRLKLLAAIIGMVLVTGNLTLTAQEKNPADEVPGDPPQTAATTEDSDLVSTADATTDNFLNVTDADANNNTRINFLSSGGNGMGVQNLNGSLRLNTGAGPGFDATILAAEKSTLNVGIGTTAPSHRLTVQNTTLGAKNQLRLIGPGGGALGFGARLLFGDPDFAFIEEDLDDRLHIHGDNRTAISGGFVGVGASLFEPTSRLHIRNGGIQFGDGAVPLLINAETCCNAGNRMIWAHSPDFIQWGIRYVDSSDEMFFQQSDGSSPILNVDFSNENVGIGTDSPANRLHVRKTDGTAKVFVEEASAVVLGRALFQLTNNGAARFRVQNSDNGATWDFQTSGGGGSFVIDRVGGPASLDFEIQPDGDAVHLGTVTAAGFITSSDRNLKTDIAPANARKLMSMLRQLDISTWRFKTEAAGTVNLGPMAQDFHRLFGMGTSTTVQIRDLAALALVAGQVLDAELIEQDAKLANVMDRVERLEAAAAR